jgi:dynein heavy chain
VQWRSYIVSEIQDKLRDIYRFYQTETTLYQESELQRLLKRIDLMFNTYLRDNVLRQGVESWCAFVRRFTVPERIDENIWKVNDYPIIVLNLEVNLNFKRKKEKSKHPKRKENEEEPEVKDKDADLEEPIKYDPTVAQVVHILTKPLEWLVETVNAFYQLEKDLVPLVDIDKLKAYEIDQTNEWIKLGMQNVEDYVRQGYVKA